MCVVANLDARGFLNACEGVSENDRIAVVYACVVEAP